MFLLLLYDAGGLCKWSMNKTVAWTACHRCHHYPCPFSHLKWGQSAKEHISRVQIFLECFSITSSCPTLGVLVLERGWV